jgi:hypothetical protein
MTSTKLDAPLFKPSCSAIGVDVEFLAHRGWWVLASEKNSFGAFQKAFAAGYGIETDVRDCAGDLVISHDMPTLVAESDRQMRLDALLDLYCSYPTRPTLALNVKSDGLMAPFRSALSTRGITQYFVFDMSVPDTLGYLNQSMRVFTRRSEFETGSILDDRAQGLWLDAFERPYVTVSDIRNGIASGRPVAIVSPELHRKPHAPAWEQWRGLYRGLSARERSLFMLCTDFPGEAEAYFKS